MSFSDLSIDVLTYILEYIRPDSIHYSTPEVRSFLGLRLLNRNFDRAIQKLRSFWIDMLSMHGPKMIGPNSKHSNIGCARNPCRIAAHYDRNELIPRYDTTKKVGAYQTMIKTFHAKLLNKKKAALKRKAKAIEKIQVKLMYEKGEKDLLEEEIKDLIKWKKKK